MHSRRQSVWQAGNSSLKMGGNSSLRVQKDRLFSCCDLNEYDSEGRKKGEIVVEPNYRMAPEPREQFRSDIARNVMADTLKRALTDMNYDKISCANQCKVLADNIKENMKRQGFSKRYKYVSLVTIGEKSFKPQSQSILLSSRCLWDTNFDNFASVVFKGKSLFAVSTVYALYFE